MVGQENCCLGEAGRVRFLHTDSDGVGIDKILWNTQSVKEKGQEKDGSNKSVTVSDGIVRGGEVSSVERTLPRSE